MKNHKRQAGFSLIGIMLALAIVAVLYMIVAKKYLSNPVRADKETNQTLVEQGLNTGNLPGTVQKAQEAADKANTLNRQLETGAVQVGE